MMNSYPPRHAANSRNVRESCCGLQNPSVTAEGTDPGDGCKPLSLWKPEIRRDKGAFEVGASDRR